jgi:HEAT repeat protein
MILSSLVVTGALTGCNKEAAAPKVDLNAQLQTLKGTDQNARMNALVAIGSMKEAAAPAIPDMLATMKDPDPDVRRLAAWVIQQVGPKAASSKPQLEALLQQESDQRAGMQIMNTIRDIDPNSFNTPAAGAPKAAQ